MGKCMTSNTPDTKSSNSQPHTLLLAQQLFCANTAYSSLTDASLTNETLHKNSDHQNDIVLFNDIVQLVKGNVNVRFVERAPSIFKKINADITLRKAYLTLVQQLQFANSAAQAAASSDEVMPSRITDNFSLKFKRDIAHPSQVYVILTINNPTEHHLNQAVPLHITLGDTVDCFYFPRISDGRSQLLFNDDDQQLKLITNNNSHIYII